jgi:hypothetical protein
MAMSSTMLGAIGLAIAAVVFLSNLLRVKVDPREPPVVHSKIPFFGHLIGMIMEGPLYMKRVT